MYRINIQRHSSATAYLPSPAKLKEWVKAALRHKVRRGELTLRLVNAKEIQALNKTYRFQNKPTNVLSFKADVPQELQLKIPLLGDIVICSAIVNAQARKQHKTYEAHWAHIVIHGSLHLLGYDHEKEADAQKMETKEIKLLKSLGFNDPYQ
jgi:probable rRNA maturation factor